MAGDPFTRQFTLSRVIDGDTIVAAEVDLGYHVALTSVTYRLARVNCPELHGPDRPAGLVATQYTQDWLTQHAAHGGLFATSTKTDDWRRWIAEINCGAGYNLPDDLLSSGNAVLYKT